MASKQYWLTIFLSPPPADKKQQITHSQSMTLKAYFDQNPNAYDAGEHQEGAFDNTKNPYNFRLDAEHSGPIHSLQNEQRFDFLISAEEFADTDFRIYVWIEPLGYATLKSNALVEALGRQHLRPEHVDKGGLDAPPPNSRPGDEQIICRLTLVGSVADFMSREMNVNGQSDDVKRMASWIKFDDAPQWIAGQYPMQGLQQASNILGCRTHSNEGNHKDYFQDLWFCKSLFGGVGGQWDHKPIINPIWGARHRFGNSGLVYYYDSWSNIHFGYVAAKAGFPLSYVLNAAGQAQGVDNGTMSTDDDPVDAQSIKEGYALGQKNGSVSITDLISVFTRNPDWEGRG